MDNIFIFSDIHANLEALTSVVRSIDKSLFNNSQKIFLGDYVNLGPWPDETLSFLRSLNHSIFVIGNHDLLILNYIKNEAISNFNDTSFIEHIDWTREKLQSENLKWLTEISQEVEFEIADKNAIGFHGSYKNPTKCLNFESIKSLMHKVILSGHIHQPFIRFQNDKILLNPGSVGESLDNDNRASYIRLEINRDNIECSIERVSYSIETVEKEMVARKMPFREQVLFGLRNGYINR